LKKLTINIIEGRLSLGDKVSLVHLNNSENIKDSVYKALELINFNVDRPITQVAIKPNLCYYWDANTGYTTDPRVVAALIDWVRDNIGEKVDIKIVEADATAMKTHLAFQTLGYSKLAEYKKVELFNLSKDTIVEKKVIISNREINYKVPQLLLETDLFINVPKLKIMKEVKITCAMKNIFGCIAFPRKIIYHSGENIDTFGKIFPSEGLIKTEHLWRIQLWLLNLYSKIVGDIKPPIIE